EATAVSDLFAVQLTAEIEPTDGGEPEEFTETRMLLRPTWSIPADRQKIRDEARQRLEQERGYKEADGNSAFISAPTRGKKLVPSNPGAKGAAARPPASTAPGGKGGAPGKGAPAPSRAPAPAPAPRPAQ
ncbi:MAG: hypothetical protein ACO29H_06780, partial [Opitutales bacterium]